MWRELSCNLGIKTVEKMTEHVIVKDDPQIVPNGDRSAKLVW